MKKLTDAEYALFLELIKQSNINAEIEISKKENEKIPVKEAEKKIEQVEEKKKEDDEPILKLVPMNDTVKPDNELEKLKAEMEALKVENSKYKEFMNKPVEMPEYINRERIPGFGPKKEAQKLPESKKE